MSREGKVSPILLGIYFLALLLNHKAAIELLVEQANEKGVNWYTIPNPYALLANNLLGDLGVAAVGGATGGYYRSASCLRSRTASWKVSMAVIQSDR